ncbi:MAG: DUF6266 family protein [Bacteroidales bacterium]|nr:DUF6266 family protein [Bacteroidales bacterium]
MSFLNPTKAESVFDSGGNQRAVGTEDISVPADWVGKALKHSWAIADGKDIANSVY